MHQLTILDYLLTYVVPVSFNILVTAGLEWHLESFSCIKLTLIDYLLTYAVPAHCNFTILVMASY